MRKRHYFYLIYIIVVSLVVTAVSFSRYSTTVEGGTQVTIAKPVLDYIPGSLSLNGIPLEGSGEGISLTDVMPGDVLVYEFDIKNYTAEDDNQVLLKYLITTIFDPDPTVLPLDYTLIADATYSSAGDGWTYMGFGSQITHGYTLTVSWDEGEIDPGYMNQGQSIEIRINSQQADSLM